MDFLSLWNFENLKLWNCGTLTLWNCFMFNVRDLLTHWHSDPHPCTSPFLIRHLLKNLEKMDSGSRECCRCTFDDNHVTIITSSSVRIFWSSLHLWIKCSTNKSVVDYILYRSDFTKVPRFHQQDAVILRLNNLLTTFLGISKCRATVQ